MGKAHSKPSKPFLVAGSGSCATLSLMPTLPYRALFCDIGGVLGTNGWDTPLRTRVCQHFHVEQETIDERHRLMFDTYERGYISLAQYLKAVFFTQPRAFTLEELCDMIYAGSQPWPENIRFLREVKRWNGLKVGLISNEGEGITQHRIEKFGLRDACDFMVISHFTGLRKPDPEIWQLAQNLAAVKPAEVIYIDDRITFAEVATGLGMIGMQHTNLDSTRQALAELGLQVASK